MLRGRDLLERFYRTGRNHNPGPTAVVRTCVQKQVGYYRPELPYTDDFELWMRFARVGDAAETDALQAIQRCHAFNQCATLANIDEWDLHYGAAFESFFFPMQNGCAGLLEGASPSELTDAPFRFLPRPGRHQPGPPEVRFQTLSDHRDPAPVTYLFRREDTIRRIVSVASEVIAWPRPSAKAARIGG